MKKNATQKQAQPQLHLYYHSDPGHGWLEINEHIIPERVKGAISSCSYKKNGTVMLEEDCDMPRVIEALKNDGISVSILEMPAYDRDCYCRNWPSYSK